MTNRLIETMFDSTVLANKTHLLDKLRIWSTLFAKYLIRAYKGPYDVR